MLNWAIYRTVDCSDSFHPSIILEYFSIRQVVKTVDYGGVYLHYSSMMGVDVNVHGLVQIDLALAPYRA
jgi:hypothetical protein